MVRRDIIAKSILEEGISIRLKGYSYIFDAINLALVQPDILKALTKELYPSIAVKNNSNSVAVERAIRNSIEKAWLHKSGKKPTNSEFLSFLNHKILSKHSLSS